MTQYIRHKISKRYIELAYIEKYHVDVKPEKLFDLAHVADAHRYLEGQNSFGKVVVVED